MAWTARDLDDLEKAYKQGILTVKYTDKQITYRSQDEMKKLIDQAKNELGVKKAGPYRQVGQFSKGFK